MVRGRKPLCERGGSVELFTITFRALPGEVPAELRVRAFLKLALRAFGLVNEGMEDVAPQDAQGERHGKAAAPEGPRAARGHRRGRLSGRCVGRCGRIGEAKPRPKSGRNAPGPGQCVTR